MNTLSRLDTYLASFLVPSSLRSPSRSPSSPTNSLPDQHLQSVPGPSRLSQPPQTTRKLRRKRRPKPTVSSVKLPPPSTPLLLRILLALWSILLSFWTSLVVETRAERSKRRKRGLTLLRELTGEIGSEAEAEVEVEAEAEGDGEAEGEGEGDGSASEIEAGIASDDDWSSPVTRAPVDEKVDEPDDDEFLSGSMGTGITQKETFSFRLRSAEKADENGAIRPPSPTPVSKLDFSPETPPRIPKTHVQQATPPSILSNPIRKPVTRKVSNKLLPNPIATAVLDPTVPAVPASKTFSMASTQSAPPVRQHTTPFHLRKTLILDLDETLIHSTSRPISYAASGGGGILGLSLGGLLGGKSKRREGHTVEVVLNGRSTTYHVYKRPHVDHFLKKVASWYTLVIFTASMPEYADPVIDWLDAGRGFFARRLYRESCHLQTNGAYIKDLSLVEADLSRVCFMDNSPISYSWNKANALPIEGWTSDPNDEALLQSIPVLDSLRFVNDVRRILGIRGFT